MPKSDTRRKACIRCTSGKRKCNLQHPSCGRCRSRKLDCVYISTRLHRIPGPVASEEATVREAQHSGGASDLALESQHKIDTVSSSSRSTAFTPHSEVEGAPDLDQALIAPESWRVLKKEGESCDYFKLDSLTNAVSDVQKWLQAWPRTGSLLFIHPNIYGSDRMPAILQDAFTACATYFACELTAKAQLCTSSNATFPTS
ncbi:uncharacterized protein AB675_10802 [Cyphellophora attinorum]|uniref:Zn(2)-C6 fungal-type domain-containing protein n=1 Tax=Cyphellophora attinorum TaxID=1664694 RepID=A0A0N1HAL6_9EURO|nr:uncharacterized protein AB675_10802 [Phialophora attinorum]KPI40924.1 hypothetical protein AB675_10802 [Phialophora attinorum]